MQMEIEHKRLLSLLETAQREQRALAEASRQREDDLFTKVMRRLSRVLLTGSFKVTSSVHAGAQL